MSDVNIIGRFRASGGFKDDIEAVLMTADDFENWSHGHQAHALYQSGRATVGTVAVHNLRSGKYVFAFSNRFALLLAKQVETDLHIEAVAPSR